MDLYVSPFENYLDKFRADRKDCSRFIPANHLRRFPRSGNEGLYGYTFRLSGIINAREDLPLNPLEDEMTKDHEGIHTNDEYETREVTKMIREAHHPAKKDYGHGPPEYR